MMISDNKKASQEPNQEDIKSILELFNSRKITDAKKKLDKQIAIYSNSSILYNIKGAILADEKQLYLAVENYKKSIKLLMICELFTDILAKWVY